MKILGNEYSKREYIFLLLLLIVTIAFFLTTWAKMQDEKSLRETTQEAINKFNQCQNGYMITSNANGVYIPNMTIKDFHP